MSNSEQLKFRLVLVDKYCYYSYKLLEGLARLGSIDIFFYGAKKSVHELKKADFIQVPKRISLKEIWTPYLYPFEISREVARDKPDAIHVQFEFSTFSEGMNMPGVFYTLIIFPLLLSLLKILRLKVVITIHGPIPINSLNLFSSAFLRVKSNIIKWILVRALKVFLITFYKTIDLFSSAIVVHGRLEEMVLKFYKLDSKKFIVIRQGLDEPVPILSSGLIDDVSKKFGLQGKHVILCPGAVSPRKNLELLLEAYVQVAVRHPNHILVIAGKEQSYYEGYLETLKRLTEYLNISKDILFTGYVEDQEFQALFKLAEAIVLPYRIMEGPSMSLSIAFQHRKPVIAADVGKFKEEIQNEVNGLLFDPRSKDELTKRMVELIENPLLRQSLSLNVDREISGRTWVQTAKETVELYQRLCRQERSLNTST